MPNRPFIAAEGTDAVVLLNGGPPWIVQSYRAIRSPATGTPLS